MKNSPPIVGGFSRLVRRRRLGTSTMPSVAVGNFMGRRLSVGRPHPQVSTIPFRATLSTTSLASSPSNPPKRSNPHRSRRFHLPNHALRPRPNNLPLRLTALAAGFNSLLSSLLTPESGLASFSLPASALPAMQGNALAAIAMCLYYSLAAYQENRAFFIATVPMRLLTAIVFGRHQGVWKTASLWEGFGAILTLGALIMTKERKGTKG